MSGGEMVPLLLLKFRSSYKSLATTTMVTCNLFVSIVYLKLHFSVREILR